MSDPFALRVPEPGGILFVAGPNREVMRFDPNGDVFVRGEKVDSNQRVYEEFRAWMNGAGLPRVKQLEKHVDHQDKLFTALHALLSDAADAFELSKNVGEALRLIVHRPELGG